MPGDVVHLLTATRDGDGLAADELFDVVLAELRRQASRLLRGERAGHTMRTTDLVHEAYLQLVKHQDQQADGTDVWRDRAHFFGAAAQAMRHILVDHARRRNSAKREGRHDRVPFDSALLMMYETSSGVDIESLNTALAELAGIRPRAAQVVDMRFFADMTVEQIACVLDVSVSTVEREWRYARAWLKDALSVSLEGAGWVAESGDHEHDDGAEGR